ncbi:MAG: hypothetical protein ABR535_05765, partial [Pyrinomonadaceae bacterium]
MNESGKFGKRLREFQTVNWNTGRIKDFITPKNCEFEVCRAGKYEPGSKCMQSRIRSCISLFIVATVLPLVVVAQRHVVQVSPAEPFKL